MEQYIGIGVDPILRYGYDGIYELWIIAYIEIETILNYSFRYLM